VTTVPLSRNAQSQPFDSNGNGQAQVGPLSAREVWSPGQVGVKTTQLIANVVNEAACYIYVGDNTATPTNYRDATRSGSSGDSTDAVSSDTVKCGQYIFAVWTGGDPGAVGVMTVTGTETV
jgi:hypothetical protein